MTDALPYANILVAAALVILAAGCRIALKSFLAPAVIVLQFVIIIPWGVPISGRDRGIIFPLAAAAVWVWWLSNERPQSSRRLPSGFVYWAVTSLFATIAVLFAPQTLVLLALVVVYYALRLRSRAVLACFVSLLVVPAAYLLATLLPSTLAAGNLFNASAWLDATIAQAWDMRAWYQASGGGPFKSTQSEINMLFYVPLLVPFAAMAFEYRKCWWFAPTFLWAAALFAGNVVFSRNLYFQHSLTMQMAFLVPFSIAGVLKWREGIARPYVDPAPAARPSD
jgi:hypothetical protein